MGISFFLQNNLSDCEVKSKYRLPPARKVTFAEQSMVVRRFSAFISQKTVSSDRPCNILVTSEIHRPIYVASVIYAMHVCARLCWRRW